METKKKKCQTCSHYKRNYYDFPCSECVEIMNGDSNMYVKEKGIIMNEERCVLCGETIPEGMQFCPECGSKTFPTGILDSGSRREFETGAVRDIQEGKGRCDLMPLDVVGHFMKDSIVFFISEYQRDGNVNHLYSVLGECPSRLNFYTVPTMFLEVAKHFEAGAKKYGEYNWQKGIPINCYIDSAVRHYLKWLRGDKDEPHDRAFVWNILCCIWTVKHKDELKVNIKIGTILQSRGETK